MKKERSYNFLLLAGSALIGLAVVLIVIALAAISPDKVTVLVPKADIAPYSGLSQEDFIAREVPKTDDSANETEFTEKWLKDEFGKKDGKTKVFFSTTTLLAGQRVDNRYLLDNPQRSLSVVKSDEAVITVTTTDAGAIGRSLRPGNVVNVAASDDEGTKIEFAKVLAIGPATQISKVITGQDNAPQGGAATDEQDVGQLLVVLAVPQDVGLSIAGKDVVMSLVPFCKVDDNGFFVSVDPTLNACTPPEGERMASQGGDETTAVTPTDTKDAASGTDKNTNSGNDTQPTDTTNNENTQGEDTSQGNGN